MPSILAWYLNFETGVLLFFKKGFGFLVNEEKVIRVE